MKKTKLARAQHSTKRGSRRYRKTLARSGKRRNEAIVRKSNNRRRGPRKIVKMNLLCPTSLCLETNTQASFEFLNDLLTSIKRKDMPLISIDFGKLVNITTGAALVLAAILHCWSNKKTRAGLRLHDLSRWDANIYYLLDQMGLFDFLKVSNPPSSHASQPHLEFLKFYSGAMVDASGFRPFREKIQNTFGDIQDMRKLYAGVVEAMSNASQHAYPPGRKYSLPRTWWSFASFDWSIKKLTICFSDLGIGIPNSLPREHPSEMITEALKLINFPVNDHAKMIKAAMVLGRTQTGKKSRGKGLPEMRQIIDSNIGSSIRILSAKGSYEYFHGGKEILADIPIGMPGTLIEWSFLLDQNQNVLLSRVEGGN